MLVLDAKRLCLQGADGDSGSEDEIEEAHSWEGVMSDFDGKSKLEDVSKSVLTRSPSIAETVRAT
jgi:hypothetical protein